MKAWHPTALWQRPVIRGVSSLAFMRYVTKAFSIARLALVANFLSPADLGSFGLALLIIAVTEVFTETGINILLVKSPKKLDEYLDTAWGVSLIRGAIISGAIFLATPALTSFYRDSSLQPFLLIAALIPFLRGFINPAIIQFQQKLQFERESLLRIVLQFTDMLAGLFLAWYWQSAVGLLWGVVVGVVAEVLLSFLLFSQRPRLAGFRWTLVKKLYHETRMIIGNGIVNYLSENLDYFIIGRVLGTTGLGLYQTGFKIAGTVTMDTGSLVGQTVYPVYAQLHEKRQPLAPLWKKTTLFMLGFFGLLAVPLLIGIEPIVQFFFRNKEWHEIIPLIRVLFIAGVLKSFITMWNPLSILAHNLQHHVVIHLLTMILLSAGIIVLAPVWGVFGAGVAVLLAYTVVQPYAWWTVKQALRRLDG